MPTTLGPSDHHVLHFTRNVELLLQQQQPRLAGCVTTDSYTGEDAQVIKQFGPVEFENFNSGTNPGDWKGDTVWSDIDHFQRWVAPSDFALSLPDAKGNNIRSLGDPRSSYVKAMHAAYARKHDDLIIAAATNPARTGNKDDIQATPLPASQIIADGNAGMTIAKLIEAREILLSAENDPNEERFLALTQKQLSNLLLTTEVSSADYNTVKALVRGEVDTFMGFKFVPTERLLVTAGPPDVRHCIAWVKSGLHYGSWNNLESHIDQRADKNYVWQVWMSFTAGATRTQEQKVVQINCAEA